MINKHDGITNFVITNITLCYRWWRIWIFFIFISIRKTQNALTYPRPVPSIPAWPIHFNRAVTGWLLSCGRTEGLLNSRSGLHDDAASLPATVGSYSIWNTLQIWKGNWMKTQRLKCLLLMFNNMWIMLMDRECVSTHTPLYVRHTPV